jgi:hypothetical protein
MAIDPTKFRADYPEFADGTAYPDSGINYYINLAGLLFTDRWDDTPGTTGTARSLKDVGIELFIAHNMVLERQAAKSAAAGAVPGITQGPVSSKGVGPANISYDTGAGLEAASSSFNLTTYGLRLMNLFKKVGAGPVLIGVGGGEPPFNGPAWPGPYPYPAPGGSGFSS